MAAASSKASLLTSLVIGQVRVPVALFTTQAKEGKLEKFDTAGPNGGALKARAAARAVPVTELGDHDAPPAEHSADPLADRVEQALGVASARESFERELERRGAPLATVDGEYGRELVEDGSGQVVRPDEVRHGVRLEDGRFVDCTDQLAAIEERTRLDQMEVVAFVDVSQIPRARVKGSYYVGVGDESAALPLHMLLKAMRARRRAAIVKLTKRSRQSLAAIGWREDALVLYELVFAEQFREAPARVKAVARAEVPDVLLDGALQLVDSYSRPAAIFDELEDDAVALRRELRAQVAAGKVAQVAAPPEPEEQQDVLSQLEASLAAVSS